MNKGQKLALKHAANRIDGTRPATGVRLGANRIVSILNNKDRHGRAFPSVYLAQRAGYTPDTQAAAQGIVVSYFGLTLDQVRKLDLVAASTHNIVQRADRVANFIRKTVEQPGYLGRTNKTTTGAVAASL